MEVLFRAEVIGIGSMTESRIKKLTQIGNRFYCIGFESLLDGQYVIIDKDANCFECKYDTRAIHFEDMLDSQGNKIFASLDKEKGKGGDILTNPNHEKENGLNEFVAVYHNWSIIGLWIDGSGKIGFRLAFDNKVIGVQQ